jgi:hypothetical protein
MTGSHDIAAMPDNTPLDAVGMTVRTRNCLAGYARVAGVPIDTLGDVRRLSEHTLKSHVRNLGKVSFAEVMTWGRHDAPALDASKKRILVDLSDWDFGHWPDDLAEAVEVEVTTYGDIEIRLKLGETYDAAVAKIAKEAVEAFLNENDSMEADLDIDGVRLRSPDVGGSEVPIFFPWFGGEHGLPLQTRSREELDKLIEWLQQECQIRGLPWPPPEKHPQEGYVTVPREPGNRTLDALYDEIEENLTRARALKNWQKALRMAAGEKGPTDAS